LLPTEVFVEPPNRGQLFPSSFCPRESTEIQIPILFFLHLSLLLIHFDTLEIHSTEVKKEFADASNGEELKHHKYDEDEDHKSKKWRKKNQRRKNKRLMRGWETMRMKHAAALKEDLEEDEHQASSRTSRRDKQNQARTNLNHKSARWQSGPPGTQLENRGCWTEKT